MAFGNLLAQQQMPRIAGMPNLRGAANPGRSLFGGQQAARRLVNRGNQTNINQTLPRKAATSPYPQPQKPPGTIQPQQPQQQPNPFQPPIQMPAPATAPHYGPAYTGPPTPSVAPVPQAVPQAAPGWTPMSEGFNIYPRTAPGGGIAQPTPGLPNWQQPVNLAGGGQAQAFGAPPQVGPGLPGWQQPTTDQQGGGVQAFGGAAQPGSPNPPLVPSIFSNINPGPIFSPTQTQTAVNQALSAGDQAAFSQHNYGRPGMALSSPAFSSRANIDAANAMTNAAGQAEGIRLGDRQANAQNVLAGQLARSIDWLGQGNNAAGFDAANQGFSNQMGQGWLQALMAGMGGTGRLLGEELSDRDFWAELGLRGDVSRNQNAQSWMQNALNWM